MSDKICSLIISEKKSWYQYNFKRSQQYSILCLNHKHATDALVESCDYVWRCAIDICFQKKSYPYQVFFPSSVCAWRLKTVTSRYRLGMRLYQNMRYSQFTINLQFCFTDYILVDKHFTLQGQMYTLVILNVDLISVGYSRVLDAFVSYCRYIDFIVHSSTSPVLPGMCKNCKGSWKVSSIFEAYVSNYMLLDSN